MANYLQSLPNNVISQRFLRLTLLSPQLIKCQIRHEQQTASIFAITGYIREFLCWCHCECEAETSSTNPFFLKKNCVSHADVTFVWSRCRFFLSRRHRHKLFNVPLNNSVNASSIFLFIRIFLMPLVSVISISNAIVVPREIRIDLFLLAVLQCMICCSFSSIHFAFTW